MKNLFYLLALAFLLFTSACQPDKALEPAPNLFKTTAVANGTVTESTDPVYNRQLADSVASRLNKTKNPVAISNLFTLWHPNQSITFEYDNTGQLRRTTRMRFGWQHRMPWFTFLNNGQIRIMDYEPDGLEVEFNGGFTLSSTSPLARKYTMRETAAMISVPWYMDRIYIIVQLDANYFVRTYEEVGYNYRAITYEYLQ